MQKIVSKLPNMVLIFRVILTEMLIIVIIAWTLRNLWAVKARAKRLTDDIVMVELWKFCKSHIVDFEIGNSHYSSTT